MEKLITKPHQFINMEKTIIHYKRLKLGVMLNAFLVGIAYNDGDLFLSFGILIIEIDFRKKRKRTF